MHRLSPDNWEAGELPARQHSRNLEILVVQHHERWELLCPWLQLSLLWEWETWPGLGSLLEEKQLGIHREMRAWQRGSVRKVRSTLLPLESPVPLGQLLAPLSLWPSPGSSPPTPPPNTPSTFWELLGHGEGAQPFHTEPRNGLGWKSPPRPSRPPLPRVLKCHTHTALTSLQGWGLQRLARQADWKHTLCKQRNISIYANSLWLIFNSFLLY